MSWSLEALCRRLRGGVPRKGGAKLALVAALACAAPVAASASPPAGGAHRRHADDQLHGRLSYAATQGDAAAPSSFLDLPQDGWSGPGFHSPPQPYRSDARRSRVIEYVHLVLRLQRTSSVFLAVGGFSLQSLVVANLRFGLTNEIGG